MNKNGVDVDLESGQSFEDCSGPMSLKNDVSPVKVFTFFSSNTQYRKNELRLWSKIVVSNSQFYVPFLCQTSGGRVPDSLAQSDEGEGCQGEEPGFK